MIFNLDPSALWQLRLTNLRKTRLAIVVPLLRSTPRFRQKTTLAGAAGSAPGESLRERDAFGISSQPLGATPMSIQIYTGIILAIVMTSAAQNRQPIPDPHKHVVAVHEEPWKTDLAAETQVTTLDGPVADIRDSVFSPNGRWFAFVFSTPNEWARVGFQEIRGGKQYQLVNLPLTHRPIIDIVWIDSVLVAFDRWSQPHYGMHYVIDIQRTRLVLAAPFPDEVFHRQQRDSIR